MPVSESDLKLVKGQIVDVEWQLKTPYLHPATKRQQEEFLKNLRSELAFLEKRRRLEAETR